MPRLPAQLLDELDAAQEVGIISYRSGGTPRRPVPVWIVRVGDQAYVRSWRGDDGAWYRHVARSGRGAVQVGGETYAVGFMPDDDPATRREIDAAYEQKYARYPSYVRPMLAEQAARTTLRLAMR